MISLNNSNTKGYHKYVLQALEEGQVSTAGRFTDLFEEKLAEYLGISDCIATNSGTSALHLALLSCGLKPGDKIIIPALSFVATKNVLDYICAEPIFVDVDINTWLILDDELDSKYEQSIFIPVNLYGNVFDLKFDYRSTIIDSAELFKKPSSDLYDFACYSFNGNKIITTGAGGAIIGQNLGLVSKFIVNFSGKYNYRMASLNAALGLAQLENIDYFIERKTKFHEIYINELSEIVQFQEATPDTKPTWWFTAGLFPEDIEIPYLIQALAMRDIPSRRIFKPLADLPNANYIYEHGLCLPSGTSNSDDDIYYVCKQIKEICGQ